jgi:uncharacterized membrane protein (UPF0136 family)
MSRAGALLMVGLAVVTAVVSWMGYQAGSMVSLVAGSICCVLLLVGGHGAWRHMTWLHLAGLVAAFFLLGRFVPAYFQRERFFPEFVMVILSAITFGIALLGLVLDNYKPAASEPPERG